MVLHRAGQPSLKAINAQQIEDGAEMIQRKWAVLGRQFNTLSCLDVAGVAVVRDSRCLAISANPAQPYRRRVS